MIRTIFSDKNGRKYIFFKFEVFYDQVYLYFLDSDDETLEICYDIKKNRFIINDFDNIENIWEGNLRITVDKCIAFVVNKFLELKKDNIEWHIARNLLKSDGMSKLKSKKGLR